MDTVLEARFEGEMRRLYEEPKTRCNGYNGTSFLQMLHELGAVATARQLAGSATHHEGLTRLWECGALDLSVEALVLRAPWNQHFSPEILAAARKKLRDLGYAEAGLLL